VLIIFLIIGDMVFQMFGATSYSLLVSLCFKCCRELAGNLFEFGLRVLIIRNTYAKAWKVLFLN
jgi:hypothetical protein